jgi:hypothetical protein
MLLALTVAQSNPSKDDVAVFIDLDIFKAVSLPLFENPANFLASTTFRDAEAKVP